MQLLNEIVTPFKDDGGAYCQAVLNFSEPGRQKIIFTPGCIKRYQPEATVYCGYFKKDNDGKTKKIYLFNSPPMGKEEIWKQQVVVKKQDDQSVTISLRNKMNGQRLILAKTQQPFPGDLSNMKNRDINRTKIQQLQMTRNKNRKSGTPYIKFE